MVRAARAAAGGFIRGRVALDVAVLQVHQRIATAPGYTSARRGVAAANTDLELIQAVHRAAAWSAAAGDLDGASRILRAAAPLCTPPRCVLWALRLWLRARRALPADPGVVALLRGADAAHDCGVR